MLFFRKGSWQGYGLVAGFDGRGIRLCSLLIVLLLEQLLQVFLDGLPHLDRKTSGQRIKGGIGIYSGSIDVEFFPPDQFFLLTLFKNGIKKAAAPGHHRHLPNVSLPLRHCGSGVRDPQPVCSWPRLSGGGRLIRILWMSYLMRSVVNAWDQNTCMTSPISMVGSICQ